MSAPKPAVGDLVVRIIDVYIGKARTCPLDRGVPDTVTWIDPSVSGWFLASKCEHHASHLWRSGYYETQHDGEREVGDADGA